MTASPFNSEGVQFAWDATSMTWAQECLWKYKASMIDGWRSKISSIHLLWGGWYADALEHFHKYLAEGVDREEALRRVVLETLKVTWVYDTEPADEGDGLPRGSVNIIPGSGRPWEPPEGTKASHASIKTRANLIRTIIWYVDHWEKESLETVILANGKPAVEYSFSIDIGNGLLWCGHIDRLVTWQGDPYVQDQKTTGSTIGPYWFEDFNPDNQFTGYAFAGKMILGTPVKGVIIDGAQVAVGFSRFERGFAFRSDQQLVEWLDDVRYYIARVAQATRDNYWPRNRTSCSKYGGCVFRDVCARSPSVRENFLKQDFYQQPLEERWNPLARR